MAATAQSAIAVIGIDIGKNSFHVVGPDFSRRVPSCRVPSCRVPSCRVPSCRVPCRLQPGRPDTAGDRLSAHRRKRARSSRRG
jgi:hypothetical protein